MKERLKVMGSFIPSYFGLNAGRSVRKKRTEIMIETARVFVRSGGNKQVRGWCTQCGGEVQMVTVDEAATVAGMKARTIYRWIEAAELHFSETPDGRLLVCFDSLLKQQPSPLAHFERS